MRDHCLRHYGKAADVKEIEDFAQASLVWQPQLPLLPSLEHQGNEPSFKVDMARKLKRERYL